MTSDSMGGLVAWAALEADADAPPSREFRVSPTFVRVGAQEVLYALDERRMRHLLVPLPDNSPAVEDRRSAGVHITTRLLDGNGDRRRFLDLACQRVHLNAVFERFASDVLSGISQGSAEPAALCQSVLGRWRELMLFEPQSGLTLEALAGLYAELCVLRDVVRSDPSGLASWQGPRGARHDFSSHDLALEVKATTSRSGWRIRVHGLDQLDDDGGVLVLLAIRLEVNGMHGESVAQAIADIASLGADPLQLDTLVAQAGYSPHQQGAYDQYSFRVVEQRAYEITDSFPRIVASSLASSAVVEGVEGVEYTLDLASCSAAKLEAAELAHRLGMLTGRARDAASN
ncbi:MAG TPA: PD-(D/E)XK motif protein [Albitalea sp.]|uniref:PD-(D/E)XK motif protein n=1 Tax=Piscinibacter sp. TaxID=1903157 RepID=UPI002ED51768